MAYHALAEKQRVNLEKHLDRSSILVMAITLVLFVAALFTKGFTHDMLLETGVFLVSVKLIMMAYQNSIEASEIRRKLTEISEALLRREP